MPSKADYMKVAKQISDYMNSFGLAFKTYKVDDFDGMIKVVAGGGARISSPKSASEFSGILQERGFLIFPSIDESLDGYVRVFRANSVIASLLSAFRYPGSDGDGQLASLLTTFQKRRRPDDFTAPDSDQA